MSRQIAYVLLDAAHAFEPATVIEAFRARHPDVPIGSFLKEGGSNYD